jgi:hypothetical protein
LPFSISSGAHLLGEGGEAAGDQQGVAAVGLHRRHQFAPAGHEGDALGDHLLDHPGVEVPEQAHPLLQRPLEIELAVHRPGGDVGHVGAHPGLVGQLVDAFLPDNRGIHVGYQQALPASLGGHHHEVDPERLQLFPDLPAVLRHLGEGEFRRLAGGEPAQGPAAPGALQVPHQRRVEPGPAGGSEENGDEHLSLRFPPP